MFGNILHTFTTEVFFFFLHTLILDLLFRKVRLLTFVINQYILIFQSKMADQEVIDRVSRLMNNVENEVSQILILHLVFSYESAYVKVVLGIFWRRI